MSRGGSSLPKPTANSGTPLRARFLGRVGQRDALGRDAVGEQNDGGGRSAAEIVEHVPHGVAQPRGLAIGAIGCESSRTVRDQVGRIGRVRQCARHRRPRSRLQAGSGRASSSSSRPSSSVTSSFARLSRVGFAEAACD